jgi:hypothetical protein
MDTPAPPFVKAAVAAFPPDNQALATGAARFLSRFVDDSYRLSSTRLIVCGKTVKIPKRIYFLGLREENLRTQPTFLPAIHCLCTRSTDGYERQAALRYIPSLNEPWSIPFVVLLSGEYVVEIIDDMIGSLSVFNREAYINFVRENRGPMRLLRSKATSYWNCYYRTSHPNRNNYPGLAFLRQLEVWAS